MAQKKFNQASRPQADEQENDLWAWGIGLAHPGFILAALEVMDVDADTWVEGYHEHPILTMLYDKEKYFQPGRPVVMNPKEDEMVRKDVEKCLEILLNAGPDLLAKFHGKTVADHAVTLMNAEAAAKIVIAAIYQSFEEIDACKASQDMAGLIYKEISPGVLKRLMKPQFKTEPQPYQFHIEPDAPAHKIDMIQDVHDIVMYRLVNAKMRNSIPKEPDKISSYECRSYSETLEEDLMARYEDRLGYWLSPYVRPQVEQQFMRGFPVWTMGPSSR